MNATATTPPQTDNFSAYLNSDLDLYVVSAEDEQRLYLAKHSLNALAWMYGAVYDAAKPTSEERHRANIVLPSESMQCLLQLLKDQIDSVALVSYRRVAQAREAREAMPAQPANDPTTH